MQDSIITHKRLRELFTYDPDSGVFIRLITRTNRFLAGDIAGGLQDNGYISIKIDDRLYKGHRLAWLYMTGEWPKNEIDHINNVRNDNRWVNLRAATKSQNQRNAQRRCDNKSGFKCVKWDDRNKKWQARININSKRCSLGYFATPDIAHAAYLEAAKKHRGEFARG